MTIRQIGFLCLPVEKNVVGVGRGNRVDEQLNVIRFRRKRGLCESIGVGSAYQSRTRLLWNVPYTPEPNTNIVVFVIPFGTFRRSRPPFFQQYSSTVRLTVASVQKRIF